jgi:hypothetical protein
LSVTPPTEDPIRPLRRFRELELAWSALLVLGPVGVVAGQLLIGRVAAASAAVSLAITQLVMLALKRRWFGRNQRRVAAVADFGRWRLGVFAVLGLLTVVTFWWRLWWVVLPLVAATVALQGWRWWLRHQVDHLTPGAAWALRSHRGLAGLAADRAATELGVAAPLPLEAREGWRRAVDASWAEGALVEAAAAVAERPWWWEDHVVWVEAALAAGHRPPNAEERLFFAPNPAFVGSDGRTLLRSVGALAAAREGRADEARRVAAQDLGALPPALRSQVAWHQGLAWEALGDGVAARACFEQGATAGGWGGRRCTERLEPVGRSAVSNQPLPRD